MRTVDAVDETRYSTVSDAVSEAEELARQTPELSLRLLLSTAPTRARDAIIVTTIAALLLLTLAPGSWQSSQTWMGPALVGTASLLIGYAGAKTSGLARLIGLRRQLARKQRGQQTQLIDVVGFLEPEHVTSPGRATVGIVDTIRLHDHPSTAISEALAKEHSPSWWTRNKPDARTVYYDGSRLRRDRHAAPAGVLLETVVECPGLRRRTRVGQPVRLIGDEKTALLLTRDGVIWPKGAWLPGG